MLGNFERNTNHQGGLERPPWLIRSSAYGSASTATVRRRQDLGLGARDFDRLGRLDSPQRIQAS